jgi:hypothetical protein
MEQENEDSWGYQAGTELRMRQRRRLPLQPLQLQELQLLTVA